MTKEVTNIIKKIARQQQKLIKACLSHDPAKQLKHRRKLFKLWLIKAKQKD